MPFEVAVFLAFLLIVGSATYLMLKVERSRMAKREDDFRREASARGWRYQASRDRHGYLQRWQGTTDFVSWTVDFESPPNRKQTPRLRWSTDTTRGPAAPVLFMGKHPALHLPSFVGAKDGGFLSSMAQKAAGFALDKAVDACFGKEVGKLVDGAALKPVENVTVPGFSVMAGDPVHAWQTLSPHLQQAVRKSVRDVQEDERHRPSILMLPRQLLIGRHRAKVTTADVEDLIRAGVELAKAQRA